MKLLSVAVLLVCAAIGSCHGELLQVIFVHRHGSRTRLGKNGTTLGESASVLTPDGMTQLYRVGTKAKARYLSKPTCSATGTCLAGNWTTWDRRTWYSQSSSLDRTLQSGTSFLLGVLAPLESNASSVAGLLGEAGGIQPVPIYSLPLNDDWIIRPFGEQKCPAYLAGLNAFYANNSYFLQRAQSYADLLDTLSSAFNVNVTLSDLWSYFDAYNVQRDYGPNTVAGGPLLPTLTNATLTQLKEASDFVEWNRYGNHSQAGNVCGGLLAEVSSHIMSGAGALIAVPPSISPGPRLVHYSAHYGTLLCLLSAINITVSDPAQDPNAWLHKIPEYGALLAIEVHSDPEAGLRIFIYLQDGPAAEYRQIILPCGTDGSCTLDAFQAHVKNNTYPTVGPWCDDCGNKTMTSCAAYNYLKTFNLTDGTTPSGAHKTAGGRATWLAAIGAVLVLAVLKPFGEGPGLLL